MKKLVWAVVAVSLGMLSLACAQPDEANVPAQAQTATVSSAPTNEAEGLIKLDVLVLDKEGKRVAGLKQGDFSLFEKGDPQKILSFQEVSAEGTDSQPPVKIILLVDTMNLAKNLAGMERSAVEKYLQQGNGQLTHPVSVYLLDKSGLREAAPSIDGRTLAAEIEQNRATPIPSNNEWRRALARGRYFGGPVFPDIPYLAALKALGELAAQERTKPGRKLLLWVGPGWGIGSGKFVVDSSTIFEQKFYIIRWFSTLLREAKLALYNFNVGQPLDESFASSSGGSDGMPSPPHRKDWEYLAYLNGVRSPKQANLLAVYRNVLAVQSGGEIVATRADLVEQIKNCVQNAGPYYRISFDPFRAEQPDEYHALKVVVDRPELTPYTSTGYYDQPYYSPEPLHPRKPVSVQQLVQLLASAHRESDAKLAGQLAGMKLTERLSEQRLERVEGGARGERTRQELEILESASEFLNPPADEIAAVAPPDLEAQRHMLTLTSEYLSKTIHRLPNFFARKTISQYQETPEYEVSTEDQKWGVPNRPYQPLHFAGESTTTVYYRDGQEQDSQEIEAKPGKQQPDKSQLTTNGVFGPVLTVVFNAIQKSGGLTWSHWERNGVGRVAVFRYTVPSENSEYGVGMCCTAAGNGEEAFTEYVGYHGELAIDPATGAVLRIHFKADMKSTAWLARSEFMIRYGRVEIGGKPYICPLRSTSIQRVRLVKTLRLWGWGAEFRTYGPYETMLEDIQFDRYHVFGGTVQILPGFTSVK